MRISDWSSDVCSSDLEEDAVADEMVMAAADGHVMAYEQSGEEDEEAFWDEHSFDLQRYASIHCLVYGSDPEGWSELPEAVEMPEAQQENCPGTYAQTVVSWDRLLENPIGRASGRESVCP